jgi:3-hexulose-6-phosphate synthase
MTKLQLALDFGSREVIKSIVDELKDIIDIVEIGTPLIIKEGLNLVSVIKNTFPNVKLLADLKIMDAGDYEANMAFEAGADIVTVLGAANDQTISAAINESNRRGKQVMVDMIAVSDISNRVTQVNRLGPDYICIHTATDLQKDGQNPLTELQQVSQIITNERIAVAGGIDRQMLQLIRPFQPKIVIIGSSITKKTDWKTAAFQLKQILAEGR